MGDDGRDLANELDELKELMVEIVRATDLMTVEIVALRACLKSAGVSDDEWARVHVRLLEDFRRFRALEYPKAEDKARVQEMLKRLEDGGSPKH